MGYGHKTSALLVMFLATFSVQWDGTELWKSVMPNTWSVNHKTLPANQHRALSEAHLPHLTRKSVKRKPRAVLPFPTITRKSCLSCMGGTHSSQSMNRAHYRNVQWLKRVHSPFQIPARWCMKHSSDPETTEHTSFHGSNPKLNRDKHFLSVFFRSPAAHAFEQALLSFQGPAVHHMCTASNFICSLYWKRAPFPHTLRMQMSYAFCAEQNHYSSADLLKHRYGSKSLRSSLFDIIFKIR